MPIRVRYQNQSDQECTIRPTPLVSVSTNILKDGAGEAFGVNYSITLTGTLIADQGTPYAIDHVGVSERYPIYGGTTPTETGPYGAFDNNISHTDLNRPPKQQIDVDEAATAIMSKQKALRALFAQDGQRMEITDFNYDTPEIICYPRLTDIQFQDGIWVDTCNFTITLEADTLLYGQGDDDSLIVDQEGTLITGSIQIGKTEADLINSLNGSFINTYDETWAIEIDESRGEGSTIPYSYRISHNLSATGKTHYTPEGDKLIAWEQARTFVQGRLADSVTDYPNIMGKIGSGTVNLVDSFGGFNHVRTEQVGESNGTYSVTETWLIASGSSYENFSTSTTTSTSDAFVGVSIEGTVKGLSQITPSGFGSSVTSAYDNALSKYHAISNTGQFGLTSDLYARANNQVAVQLNSQPLSATVGSNEFNGEISYNLQFNNRPTNIISGTLAESITINDTYPGDVFAVIPVLGRNAGPVLQYIGGRTEYKRDLSINLLVDYTRIPYGATRNPLILKKPSVIEPMATEIANLISELSPAGEPNIVKYFISPPQETWDPKLGSYSFNLSWTYELQT